MTSVLDAALGWAGLGWAGLQQHEFAGHFCGFRRTLLPCGTTRRLNGLLSITRMARRTIGCGAGAYLPDLEERWEVPTARDAVFDVARRCADVPEMLGVGPHLLLIASRSAE